MRISTEPFYKLFSVVHNYFYQCFYSLRGYMMIVSLQNVSENLEKLREKENLKMPISTKPFYKLFSTVHNYFLWMFLIIERIYDDRIPRKCSQKLRKFATWNLKMRISTEPFYKLFSVVHNYFLSMFLFIERIYDHRIPRKCSQKLENLRKTWNLKMRISTKSFHILFSVVHNNFQWMCLISERIYDDRIPRKCSQNLRKFAKNLKPENANIYQVIFTNFSVWFTTTFYECF